MRNIALPGEQRGDGVGVRGWEDWRCGGGEGEGTESDMCKKLNKKYEKKNEKYIVCILILSVSQYTALHIYLLDPCLLWTKKQINGNLLNDLKF